MGSKQRSGASHLPLCAVSIRLVTALSAFSKANKSAIDTRQLGLLKVICKTIGEKNWRRLNERGVSLLKRQIRHRKDRKERELAGWRHPQRADLDNGPQTARCRTQIPLPASVQTTGSRAHRAARAPLSSRDVSGTYFCPAYWSARRVNRRRLSHMQRRI